MVAQDFKEKLNSILVKKLPKTKIKPINKKKKNELVSFQSYGQKKEKDTDIVKPFKLKKRREKYTYSKAQLASKLLKRQNARQVKTKKNINFVVRVYIDEDYSKYKKREYTKTRDASIYTKDANGKFRSHTKKYKIFTHRAFFMRGNTKNIKPFLNREVFGFDGKDLNNFRIAISKYTGGDELNSSIKSWFSLLDYLMFVVEDVSYSDPFEADSIDYNSAMANDDNATPFQSKYIKFDYLDGKMVVPYSTDYIKENFIHCACWYSVIIDTFKKSWDAWYKNNPLTYEFLYKVFHGVEMTPESDMSLNFDTVVNKFFKPYKIGIVLFDVNYCIRCKYLPRDQGLTRNKHISPNVLYVMLHKRHITRINKDINSLSKKLDQFELENDLIFEPSTSFHLPKEKDNRTFKVIDNVEDIIKVLTEGEGDYIEVIYNQDLLVLWREVRDRLDFEMEIHFVGNTITSLKAEDANTIVIKDVYSMNAGQLFFDNESEYTGYIESKNKFSTKLLNKNYLSRYSENVNEVFHLYTRGGIIGGFDMSVDNYNLLALDYNKYYTKQLMNMPFIPVINSFDNFVEYKGEDIEEMNLYIYEKLDDELTYPLQRQGIIYGRNILRRKPNVKLLAVLKPNTLKENKTGHFINELYKNDIDTQVKKFIVNQTIGMTNKKYNKKYYSTAFTKKEDAINNFTRYGGGLFEHYLYTLDELNKDLYSEDDEKIYFHYCFKKVELEEGFYPIGLYILDSAEAELFELVDKAKNQGMKVYGVNTDCIYVNKVIGDFDLGEKIGQLKIEKKEMVSFNPLKIKENCGIWRPPVSNTINIIEIEDEWNKEEIKSKLVNKTILQAVETAGAGKTTALKQLEKCLFVIPFNAQREDLESEGKDVCTLYQLLGLRINDNFDVENCVKSFDITAFDNIVFDEIFLYTVRDLEKIKDFMKRNDNKNFFATGDIDQLPPIENLNNVGNIKDYYKNIVYSLFPNHIYLYENKRFTNQEDREKIKKITKTFLYGTREERIKCIYDNFKVIKDLKDLKTKKNLSAYNRTIDRVNNHFGTDFKVGQKIICRKPIIRKGCRTYVNYVYIIEDLHVHTTVKLRHGEEYVIIDKKELDCFRPAFCQTTHSVQGLTIKEPFTIFDALSPMATGEWLNTSITRATDFKNITFFITNYDFYTELKNVINSRLIQLKEDDKMKNRDFDLDSEWVYNEIKNCGWRCKMCKCSLDVFGNEAFSIDRICNHLGHLKFNCQILCRRCNVSKR